MEWKKYFSTRILQRGYEYFKEGNIIECTIKDRRVEAIVAGSEDYHIFIDLDALNEMSCTCPYYEGGSYCKHLAAVFYHIDYRLHPKSIIDQQYEDEYNDDENYDYDDYDDEYNDDENYEYEKEEHTFSNNSLSLSYDDKEINKVLQSCTKEQLISFLVPLFKKHGELFIEFSQYTHQMNETIFDAYINQAYSVISYEPNQSRIQMQAKVGDYIYRVIKPLIHRYPYHAFELMEIIYNEAYELEEEGDIIADDVIYPLYDVIEEMIQSTQDSKLLDIVFKWIIEILEVSSTYDTYSLQKILMTYFQSKKYNELKLKLIDKKITEVTRSALNLDIDLNTWLDYRIAVSHQLGLSLKQFYDKYGHLPIVKEKRIQDLISRQDYNEALSLLLEMKKQDLEDIYKLREHSKKLVFIYENLNDQENYRKELWLLITSYEEEDIKYYKKLKSCFDHEYWMKELQFIIKILNRYSPLLEQIYEEEGMAKELLQLYKETNQEKYLINHMKLLMEFIPEEFLIYYKDYLYRRSANVSNRKQYAYLVSELRRLVHYPKAQSTLLEIVLDWRTRYKSKPAFIDELSVIRLK